MIQLTFEQEFELQKFKQYCADLSREQAIETLIQLYAQKMAQENAYKELVAHNWGMGNG
jgi:Phycobilisome degradation protein nblA